MKVKTWRPHRLASLSLQLVLIGCAFAARTICQAQGGPAPMPAAAVDPAAAALAGFDETTGLWFPPDAPREVYLSRSDPDHDLIRDVQKAFKADPALRKAACALAADPRREVRSSTLEQSVRQRLTMFHMICAGEASVEHEKQRSEDLWRESKVRFERARKVSAALSGQEKRARFLELEAQAPSLDVNVRLDRAFEMLGLMPQAGIAVYVVLRASPYQSTQANARFQDYLWRLLERESSGETPEAARYRMAMQHYLYFTNRLPEARAVARSALEEVSLSRWKADNRIFLGLLDRLSGDVSALGSAARACRPDEDDATDYTNRPDSSYCYDLYFGFAVRSIELNGEKAPVGLTDVLEEVIAAEPANWPRRATASRYAVRLDPARGRALAEELLQVPATIAPLGARLDALSSVGAASQKLHDFGRALAAFDRYLDFLRYRPAPPPPDLWGRLTVLPEAQEDAPSLIERSGWLNIAWALGEKVTTLIDAGDLAGARRGVEAFLVNALDLARVTQNQTAKERLAQLVDLEGLEPEEREELGKFLEQEAEAVRRAARNSARWTRFYLQRYGVALVKAGRRDEARRIAAFLIAQPGGTHNLPTEFYPVFFGAMNKNEPFPPAASPWDAAPDPNAEHERGR